MSAAGFDFEIASAGTHAVTSDNLRAKVAAFQSGLNVALQKRSELACRITQAEKDLAAAQSARDQWGLLSLGFLFKQKRADIDSQIRQLSAAIGSLKEQIAAVQLRMTVKWRGNSQAAYATLVNAFRKMSTSDGIWDITKVSQISPGALRTVATSGLTIQPVTFDFSPIPLLSCDVFPMHLQNANGADLYFYPNVLLMRGFQDSIGLIDYSDIVLSVSSTNWVEMNPRPPRDAAQVDSTWAKTNKDGSPDRRFADNYKVPIFAYGTFHFESAKGLNEAYMVSNRHAVDDFGLAFTEYQRTIRKG